MDLEYIRETGVNAANKGAEILLSHFGNVTNIRKKGAIDLVTIADTESEQTIINTIRSEFPDHNILAEESGNSHENSEYQWIIDPLDGTTNFAHGLGLYAISIAFAIQSEIVVGIVFNPATGELFSATKGQGATLNGKTISVSNVCELSDSLLVTGFPYDFKNHFNPIITRFENCMHAAQGIRRLGAAALDLCYVACGRFEGFWEQNLKPWDTAAGILIAGESGAIVTDFSNCPFTIDKNEILVTNGKIHKRMLSLMEMKNKYE